MFRKVVIPLDGSELAEQVFDALPSYVSPMEAELVLVQTIEAWQYTFGMDMNGEINFLPYLRTSARAYLKKAEERLAGHGYQTTSRVTLGDPATEILNTVTETGADLIAMSTHGRSGIRHWALGSVAERVLHHSPQPVLLVREETNLRKGGINRILVPLDGSERAEQALPAAIAIAKDTGAEIILLQMIQTLDEANTRILFETETEADTLYQKWLINAETYLREIALRLHAEGVDAKYLAHLGDAATGIANAATGEEIDLVALSTHGRTGLGLWFYGSVAGKVMRSVLCPVLLVRSTNTEGVPNAMVGEVIAA